MNDEARAKLTAAMALIDEALKLSEADATPQQEPTQPQEPTPMIPSKPSLESIAYPIVISPDSPRYEAILSLSKPENATSARVIFDVTDAENVDEGELWLNGQKALDLWSGEQTGNDARGSVSYNLDPNFFNDGANIIEFKLVKTYGFTIHSLTVAFGVGPQPSQKRLDDFAGFKPGPVTRQNKTFDEFPVPGVMCGWHPSLRCIDASGESIVFASAGLVYSIADLIATRGSGRIVGRFSFGEKIQIVGRFSFGEKIQKAEFHPTEPNTYVYMTQTGALLQRSLTAMAPVKIFDRADVIKFLGQNVREVVSGPSELGLISAQYWAGYAVLDDKNAVVLSYDLNSDKFNEEGRFQYRNGKPDYVGVFGMRSAVLKNNKQNNGLNDRFPYDLYALGAKRHNQADTLGMYHSTGISEGGADYLADISGRWYSPTGSSQLYPQPLTNLACHVAAVWGLDGTVAAYGNQGDAIVYNRRGGIWAGLGMVKDGYFRAFVYKDQLWGVVTKAMNDVWLRRIA